MRIVGDRAVQEFIRRHPESEQPLVAWFQEVRQADWSKPADVRERYPRASIVGRDRVVFRVRGNRYRIVAQIFYPGRVVHIRFVGTHSEYDRINAEEV